VRKNARTHGVMERRMAVGKQTRAPTLEDADLGVRMRGEVYARKLPKLQRKLTLLQEAYLFSGLSGVIVFEGWDAAGKGGTIRRISAALDPRSFKVWPIGPPRRYYLERHYFLRFMERLPPVGAIAAFDRSWYGRVLVERVEELTPVDRWRAAYREIVEFERMLTDDGTRIAKLFFHISPEEQLKRFEARLKDPLKRWKLSYEDFRNRKRWDAYAEATDEMFTRTSTAHAPWCLIPANDKKHARIAAMTEIIQRLGDGVDLGPPKLDDTLLAEAREHFDLNPLQIARLSGRTE
jgi:polyphosphate kinase 2 (PPK2 family)